MIRFSIIIPVYNIENYIKRCITSVLDQKYQNYEVIIVNDGSTDGSQSVIDEFLYDNRITIISQENRGLGGARNAGLKVAKGEYLFFLDGDDYLELDALESLNHVIESDIPDVIIFNAFSVNDHSNKKTYLNLSGPFSGRLINNKAYYNKLIQLAPANWNKVVKRAFFQNSQFDFPEKIKHEDVLITRQILLSAKTIYALKKPLYYYVQREGSIMNSAPSLDVIFMHNQLTDYFSNKEIYANCKDTLEATAVRNIAYVYIARCYKYLRNNADISDAVANINERYPNWRDNPCINPQEKVEIDLLLKNNYQTYILRFQAPRTLKMCLFKLLPGFLKTDKIKKLYHLLKDREFKKIYLLIIGKLSIASKPQFFAGSYCSRLDIVKHKFAYLSCESHNDNEKLPKDFPFFKTKGQSKFSDEILISPHTNNFEDGYLFIIDGNGIVQKFKKINGFGYAFRKIILSNNEVVYAYLQTKDRFNNAFDNTELVVLDNKLEKEIAHVSMIKHDSIPYDGYSCDNHEYKILGNNHYILTCVKNEVISNVPGFEGIEIKIIDSIIQEQKDGKVVFQFTFSEHPELLDASLFPGDYSLYIDDSSNSNYSDCAHLNSIDIDPKTGDWLLSYRSIGLVKIDHTTGDIKWVLGRKRCDIASINKDNICLYQHDARYQSDGSITVFDNYGNPNDKSRICKYWIDEESLSMIRYKEYDTNIKKSEYMGCAQLIDDDNETFEIAYGSGYPFIAFEEYDFKNHKQNFELVFKDGYDLYQVHAEK